MQEVRSMSEKDYMWRPPQIRKEKIVSTTLSNSLVRRRRKRARNSEDESNRPLTMFFSRTLPSLDDTALAFLDRNGDILADSQATPSSIPILLEARRSGHWKGRSKNWELRMLKNHIRKPHPGHSRRQWRSFAQRAIPFTHLGTPHGDAVLAMDRQGSKVICLGSKDIWNAPLALALRLYGIPSPSSILAQQRKNGYLPSDTSIGATLLQTIPLLHEIPEESPEDAIFNFRRGISPATTPVKILLSNDWRMGVALFQPSNVWREEGPVGTLILFSTPCAMNSQSNASTIWQCTNVKMGADASFSCRNLLWKVEKLPLLHSDSTYSISVLNVPGYLFLNDEEDGYRLTWVADRSPDDVCTPSEPILISTIGEDKTILSFERTWERYDSDLRSGERIVPLVAKTSGMEVFCESFVHIQVLLNAILSQRKGMSEEKPSDFLYSLISTTNAGRAAEFIITFIRTQRPGSLGVFVEVDLFSGRYQERNWVKNVSAIDSVALRNWSNALALNQRMKQLRVGPYSVKPNHAFDWSKLCIDSSFDPDSCDDFSPFFWQDYVDSEEAISTRKPPKFISISTLYPDCDLITNKAITDCLPVCYLRGKDSPIEVIYG